MSVKTRVSSNVSISMYSARRCSAKLVVGVRNCHHFSARIGLLNSLPLLCIILYIISLRWALSLHLFTFRFSPHLAARPTWSPPYPTASRWMDDARRRATPMGITNRASFPECSPPRASVVRTRTLCMVRHGPWSSPHQPGETSNALTDSDCSASRLVLVVSQAYCCERRFRPARPRSVTASNSPRNA